MGRGHGRGALDRGSRDRRVGANAGDRRIAGGGVPERDGEHVWRPHAGDDEGAVRRPRGGQGCRFRKVKVEEAPNPLAEGLHDYRVADPAVMVIFGATGDLSGRKLLPALYNLAKQRSLPAGFAVVGTGRDDLNDQAFRKHASDKIHQFSRTQPIDGRVLAALLASLSFVKVDFSKLDDFKVLATKLQALDDTRLVPRNRMVYCATPPQTYELITVQLQAAGLNTSPGFRRIVIEKPFGLDLKSARELTETLH